MGHVLASGEAHPNMNLHGSVTPMAPHGSAASMAPNSINLDASVSSIAQHLVNLYDSVTSMAPNPLNSRSFPFGHPGGVFIYF